MRKLAAIVMFFCVVTGSFGCSIHHSTLYEGTSEKTLKSLQGVPSHYDGGVEKPPPK
jgi:hypothetical protein